MLKNLRENLLLKVIALATSLMIWFYARAERNPNPTISHIVTAEVVRVGAPRDDLIVRVPALSIPVEVIGPKNEIDTITENEIKARVDVTPALASTTRMRVQYVLPDDVPNVKVVNSRETISVEVVRKRRKQMRIEPFFNSDAPAGTRYGTPRLDPEWAYVAGSTEDLDRVAHLVVFIETSGGGVRADLPIKAVDKDTVEVSGVQIEPQTTRVTLTLLEAPSTRTFVVSVPLRGNPAPPYQISEITIEPDQVTVAGKPDQLAGLTNIATSEVSVEGITSDVSKDVPLLLPPSVTVKGGQNTVHVTVRVRDVSKPNP
jgi:YbbR domain-containing protein